MSPGSGVGGMDISAANTMLITVIKTVLSDDACGVYCADADV